MLDLKKISSIGAALFMVAVMFSCSDDDKSSPALGAQIDRVGRAAVSTGLIKSVVYTDAADRENTKNTYNAAAATAWGSFSTEIKKHVAIFDGLDETCGNSLAFGLKLPAYDLLGAVLADDRLYVGTDSGDCDSYLALEVAVATDGTTDKCGGRTLDLDVIDLTYTSLAGAAAGDGVASDDATHSNFAFPYVAAPL